MVTVTKTLRLSWTTRFEKWFAVHLLFMRILRCGVSTDWRLQLKLDP